MNLFEKVFNHQILSRIEDSGTYMVTAHERAWLKTMLQHRAAVHAFSEETLNKLHALLEDEQGLEIEEHILHKASSLERQVYHPLIPQLRRHIMNQQGIKITYAVKHDRIRNDQLAFPYKLEYSMVKREWYLLWYNIRHHSFMSTKLSKIAQLTSYKIEPRVATEIVANIQKVLSLRKQQVVIEIVSLYNGELSRILYALSSFEKEVSYVIERDTYIVTLTLLSDESEYLLSKLRFLGKRVKVIQGDYLKRRMLETSMKALARYEVQEQESNV